MDIAGVIFLPIVIALSIWGSLDTIKRRKNGTDNGMMPLERSVFVAGFSTILFIGCLLSVLGIID